MNETRTNERQLLSSTSPESPLRRIANIAHLLGSERITDEAEECVERIEEGRFYVACVGQFKRGKSTLIGALVGERILPTGVLPITSVPTVVRYGRARSVRIRLMDKDWISIATEELVEYVSEDRNPENSKGVTGAEVFMPNPLLAEGMCLVDTPGLGSVFGGNTAATKAFIPQIDAALVVLGVDPPLTADELAMIDQIAGQTSHLVFVLNKADRVDTEERELAKSFAVKTIEKRLNRSIGRIFEVSAEEQLENHGPERDWNRLIEALRTLVRQSGRTLVCKAEERAVRRLTAVLLATALEEREALARPVQESERRIENLRSITSGAEQSFREIGPLFTAEEQRLAALFLKEKKQFLANVTPRSHVEFKEEFIRVPRALGPARRRHGMRIAQAVCERHIRPWLQAQQEQADEKYRKATERFISIGNDFLKRLAESGAPEFAHVPNALDAEKGFRIRSRFHFEGLITVARPASPLRFLADVFVGAFRGQLIQQAAEDFLDRLLDINSTRVESDLRDRVRESRKCLEVNIREVLNEVCRIAEQASKHAQQVKSEGASAVERRVSQLIAVEEELRRSVASLEPSVFPG